MYNLKKITRNDINKVSKCSLEEYRENKEKWKKEFLEIFE